MNKSIPEDIERQLLDYIDGALSGAEKEKFESLMAGDPALKARISELRTVEVEARTSLVEEPSRNFTAKVMANLHRRPAIKPASLRNGLLLLGGTIVLVGLCLALLASGIFDGAYTSLDLNQIGVIRKYFPEALPSVGLDGKLLVNAIIFLNLALALVVLDRSVLKPLFQKRINNSL